MAAGNTENPLHPCTEFSKDSDTGSNRHFWSRGREGGSKLKCPGKGTERSSHTPQGRPYPSGGRILPSSWWKTSIDSQERENVPGMLGKKQGIKKCGLSGKMCTDFPEIPNLQNTGSQNIMV